MRVWVISDGKVGDDVQCAAVAEGLAGAFERRRVAPRPPWEWFAPWGPIDPRDRMARAQSPIAPPFPDVIVASGRRSIPYARAVKKACHGFLVILKDPRIAPRNADLIWVPAHDARRGKNVISSLTSPHGLARAFAERRQAPAAPVAHLPKPLLGLVLGGPGGGARYDAAVAEDLAARVNQARPGYASLAVVPSRRTPAAFVDRFRSFLKGEDVFVWRGEDPNPYLDILANAGGLIVAADSHNMMSEAVATGTGVYAWRPPGLAKKLDGFVRQLEDKGLVRRFETAAPAFKTEPLDATPDIVAEIRRRMGRT
jgi:hypothetical protein